MKVLRQTRRSFKLREVPRMFALEVGISTNFSFHCVICTKVLGINWVLTQYWAGITLGIGSI